MRIITRKPEDTREVKPAESDEAFEGFVEALGILPPEMLRDPDAWLALSDTDAMQAVCGNLARVPVLSERWG